MRTTARISPYMRFGELGVRQVYWAVMDRATANGGGRGSLGGPKDRSRSMQTFLRRLAWRDLAYWALWRFESMADQPLRPWYNEQQWAVPWTTQDSTTKALAITHQRWGPSMRAAAPAALRAWQRGETGYPLVDAAMTELWVTGYMPNYMRHVVAGFLVEYLGIDWRHATPRINHACARVYARTGAWAHAGAHMGTCRGRARPHMHAHARTCACARARARARARAVHACAGADVSMALFRHGELWFHETLVDADVAINAFMWQNGGHSGMDQWNFVMHPVFAAKSADPEGDYVRRWLPQLGQLPVEYIHCPWEAPPTMLAKARVVLGRDYARRVVTDLEGALRRSVEWVVELRRGPGKPFVLPDGNEAMPLPDGRLARCITRVDYRVDSDKPLTKQSAAGNYPNTRTHLIHTGMHIYATCVSTHS